MTANDRQEGGAHYKRVQGEQLWDRLVRVHGLDKDYMFFVGSAMSYLERYRLKDGVKDLKKAKHFIEKLIELEEAEEQRGKET